VQEAEEDDDYVDLEGYEEMDLAAGDGATFQPVREKEDGILRVRTYDMSIMCTFFC
jgi:hypothetical protein